MEYEKLTANFFADKEETREEKIRSAAKSFINLIIESQCEEINTLYKVTKPGRNSGQAYLQELEIDDDIKKVIFDIGYSDALLDMMQLYLEKVSVQKEIDKVKTKYRNDILRILMEKRIMFHKDLAGAIGVSASGLNAVIKQMNATSVKLINVDKISKFTLYSLTPAAYQYGQKLSDKKEKKKKDTHQVIREEMYFNMITDFPIKQTKETEKIEMVLECGYIASPTLTKWKELQKGKIQRIKWGEINSDKPIDSYIKSAEVIRKANKDTEYGYIMPCIVNDYTHFNNLVFPQKQVIEDMEEVGECKIVLKY